MRRGLPIRVPAERELRWERLQLTRD